MSESLPERPTVVIVGRPNVGKSTLFNALIGQRRSIVGDEPGITRDRIEGEVLFDERPFTLIDTGGIVPHDQALIPSEIFRQARTAFEQADQIIFVIDGRAELTGIDRELSQLLKRLGKPVTVAVNKIDHPKRDDLTVEFYSLGFEHIFGVSAEHRRGIEELLEHITADFTRVEPEPMVPRDMRPIRVAIVGRPNTGKSTLLNSLTGSDRAIVSPIAGTTRDAVDETITFEGRDYTFIDTAGIRRKGKTHEMAEKLSVVMARKHIETADVVLILVDAVEGPTAQDATIAGYAHEEGRCVVMCVNKWDLITKKDKAAFEQLVRDEMKFLEYASLECISAKKGTGVKRLFKLIRESWESAGVRASTGELNRFLDFLKHETDIKLKYMTQVGVRPPTFVLFAEARADLHFSTERFLINQLRKRFGFTGTPVRIKLKKPEPHERWNAPKD